VVRLAFEAAWLEVEVTDDGHAPARPSEGNGLRGIAERVATLGGQLAVGHAPSGGFRVWALLPLQADE
jgi:signal transduction histidine kinase